MVRVYDGSGTVRFDFLAFEANFTGGVRVATADLNGDGVEETIVSAGPLGGPRVRVFDGASGEVIRDFFAFTPSFRGGVYVAAGDVNGDGIPDLICGAGSLGSPHVTVFDGKTGEQIRSFFAYSPNFLGGVRVGAGDLNGDGVADIVVAPGPGGGPHVRAFDGLTGAQLVSFFAVEAGYQAGLFVSVLQSANEGFGSIVVGRDSFPDFEGSIFVFLNEPGTGGAGLPTTKDTLTGPPTLSVFGYSPQAAGGVNLTPATTNAYSPDFVGGVRVASRDVTGEGDFRIVTGPGQNGGSLVRIFEFLDGNFNLLGEFAAFDPEFTGSVYVG